MDELGGCLFELIGKMVSTKVGCTLLIIFAIIGGYLIWKEVRTNGWGGPSPYQDSRAPGGGPLLSQARLPTL